MIYAIKHLFGDFLSTIVFIAIYAVTGMLPWAIVAAVAVAGAQIGFAVRSRQTLDPIVWLSLFLAVAFGLAALVAKDPRFVMVKPSIIHGAIAVAMLRRGWMARYLPEQVRGFVPEDVVVASGYGWAAFMMALAALNLLVAFTVPFQTWAWFVSVGLLGAKVMAFGVQYAVFRIAATRRAKRMIAASAPLNGTA